MKYSLSLGIIAALSFTCASCIDTSSPQNQDYIVRTNEEIKEVIAQNKESEEGIPTRGIGKGVIEQNFSSSVYGKVPQYIVKSNVSEGVWVKKGDLLFQLESEELEDQIEKLDVTLAERELALREILIGQGYSWEKKNSIPQKKFEFAKIKSGYNSVLKDRELARKKLEKTKVYAPTSGFVENLKAYKGDLVNPSTPLCQVVNVEELKVVFYVLEAELKNLKLGKTVHISPLADESKQYDATIFRVVSRVTPDGMIKVKARLANKEGLLPGMNVFVTF